VVHGRMLIVDASCLYDVVSHGSFADQIETLLDTDPALAAPHVIDVEVLSIIRRDHLRGLLDRTAAQIATAELRDWPGERFSHRPLLDRAWELRHNVRSWDAFYVALAEALDATLITRDRRLGRVRGLRCNVEVVR
jgi:predicted nucleic acid-binding protein